MQAQTLNHKMVMLLSGLATVFSGRYASETILKDHLPCIIGLTVVGAM